jgi:hypothetical protein
VIPSKHLSKDLLLYGQFMRFDMVKVTTSAYGRKRFHLKKNHTSFCVEEWDLSSNSALQPYLEVIVSSQQEYSQLLEEISLNSGLQPTLQPCSIEAEPLVVLFQGECMQIKVICFGNKEELHNDNRTSPK